MGVGGSLGNSGKDDETNYQGREGSYTHELLVKYKGRCWWMDTEDDKDDEQWLDLLFLGKKASFPRLREMKEDVPEVIHLVGTDGI